MDLTEVPAWHRHTRVCQLLVRQNNGGDLVLRRQFIRLQWQCEGVFCRARRAEIAYKFTVSSMQDEPEVALFGACRKSRGGRRALRVDDDDGYFRHAGPVSYTHLRAHETRHDLVCRLLLEK